ncbi:F-box protein At1g11270-like [Trifolium pratense]|uniref:F-box protein At1g11270-like n=1 Tax=Trifolium pratense TaxID=57577 RepID=UPI001E695373|nr:F-box protein At1g11270-like [Trifolium pratense]
MSLGIDLENEILAWLPPKSLMRFRCVQKSWNLLFETPNFYKKWRMNMSDCRSDHVIFYEKEPYVTLLSSDNLIHIRSLYYQAIEIKSYGSCNGVFCLSALFWFNSSWFDQLIMWNPVTREVHRIPPTPCLNSGSPLYGFGADDPNSTDFKIVRLHTTYDGTAEVYSLSTKSWIPTQNPPPFTIITRRHNSKFNTLVNGVYHWITNDPDDYNYNGANILCFDFRNNQFGQLIGPAFSYEDYSFLWDDVAEIESSLAYVAYVLQCNSPERVSLKIWVLDQSGWNKEYNINLVSHFHLCGLWKNGTQFFGGYLEGSLTSRDRQGNTICRFDQIPVGFTKYWVHEYMPSIAPLGTRQYIYD